MRYIVIVVVMAASGILSWSYLANLTLDDKVALIGEVVSYASNSLEEGEQVPYENVPKGEKERKSFGIQSLITDGEMTKPDEGERIDRSPENATGAPDNLEDSEGSKDKESDTEEEAKNETSVSSLEDQSLNTPLAEVQTLAAGQVERQVGGQAEDIPLVTYETVPSFAEEGDIRMIPSVAAQAHLSQSPPSSKSGTVALPRPQIAIVIDDMGLELNVSRRMVALPRPLTMAWLPYGDYAPELAAEAHENGHEILIHAPMEPKNAQRHDPGPIVLSVSDNRSEIRSTLTSMLARFENYAGINNHMGSRFTENKHSMTAVAGFLRERGLIFLDSLTSSHSVAGRVVANAGVSTVKRDLFIDVDRSRAAIDRQLAYTEKHARLHGRVVAIGHPGLTTFQALSDWLPTLKAKGFDLVPVSTFASRPDQLAVQVGPRDETHLQLALGYQK